MLLTTGTGLNLVSHRLINGQMQYEGYDNKQKHLFTFTVPDCDGDGCKIERTNSVPDSEFSGDDSRIEQTAYGESMMDATEKMTEYDATEKLLVLQQQLTRLREGSVTMMHSDG